MLDLWETKGATTSKVQGHESMLIQTRWIVTNRRGEIVGGKVFTHKSEALLYMDSIFFPDEKLAKVVVTRVSREK